MTLSSKLVLWRRHLHAHPELSFQEFATSGYIGRELEQLGVEVSYLQPTGVVGLIKGSGSGPTIALRADIDALALEELKQVSYRSKVPGVMHGCGHDGHCAILLGVAEELMEKREQLRGTVRLIFQPAEERPPGGALKVIEQGFLQGVDWIFGLHLWNGIPAGLVGLAPGPMMANSDEFVIRINGKGGHGSMPQDTVDAILVAAQVVVALQSIVSRNVDPLEPGVVSVGTFNAGSAFNIIAQSAEIRGTYRSFSQRTRVEIESRIKQLAEGVCAAFGASCTVNCERGYPALINQSAGVELLRQAAVKVVGEKNLIVPQPVLGGEDFGYYLQQVPGGFMFLGAGGENPLPHHHPGFDFSEDVMETGVRIFLEAVSLAQGKQE